jgi:hypothetical protein
MWKIAMLIGFILGLGNRLRVDDLTHTWYGLIYTDAHVLSSLAGER